MLIQIARQLAALLLCLTLAVSGGEEGFLVGLRDQTEPDCWLCDVDGAALAPVPVGEDVTLGPLGPGRYQLRAGGALLGEFLLDRQAVILRAGGRLWTDGELLHLAPQPPGTLSVRCTLPGPGYYPLSLADSGGDWHTCVVNLAPDTAQDPGGGWVRWAEFPGLPPGTCVLYYASRQVALAEIAPGALTVAEIGIDG